MKQRQKLMIRILFLIYLILLVWIILMKTEFSFANIYRMRSTNFIPFEGTAVYNNRLDYKEIYLNILIFVPFGIYLSMLKPNWSFFKKILPIFLASLSFESLQYVLAIGATDITDLMGNTLGGIFGIIFYSFIHYLFKNKTKANRTFTLLASITTMSFVLFFGILLLANR